MTAHSGQAALDAVDDFKPEVLLLDIGLPGMDGYELARRLKEKLADAPAFYVAVSGYGRDEDRRQSKSAGFDAHLTKPVEWEELETVLRREPIGAAERPGAGGA